MNNHIKGEGEISSTSPILSTRYAHKAAKMIHSLEGKFIIVIGVQSLHQLENRQVSPELLAISLVMRKNP